MTAADNGGSSQPVRSLTAVPRSRLAVIAEDPKMPPMWAAGWVLAEDDWGDLCGPCGRRSHRHGEPWWHALNLRHPRHLLAVALTLATGWLAHVEGSDG